MQSVSVRLGFHGGYLALFSSSCFPPEETDHRPRGACVVFVPAEIFQ